MAVALKYPAEWKYEGVGFSVPQPCVLIFFEILKELAGNDKRWLETFKAHFGRDFESSSFDFAVYDLREEMTTRAQNAARFVDSLWRCIESADSGGLEPPPKSWINKKLAEQGVPLVIEPPDLRLASDASIEDDLGTPVVASLQGTDRLHYRLGKEIGAGGFGRVYSATRTTGAGTFQFAIKILDPHPFITDHDKARRRFTREIQALSGLQHRAIVPIFEAGIDAQQRAFIVMPLVEGADLRQFATANTTLNVCMTFAELLLGLDYAHSLGVIHRDLKPSNIIIRTADRQPVILDFGASYLLSSPTSRDLTSHAVGTIGYVPSEVIADPTIRSPQQDIYAVGVMLYEAVAGRRPDPNNYQPLASIRTDASSIDAIVRSAIAGITSRTESAGALRAQLLELIAGGGL